MKPFASCIIMTALLFVLPGCGSDLSSVKGKVTLDGAPLPGAFVEYTPKSSNGSTAYGKTDTSGNYYLMFSLNRSGAIPGDYVVRITTAEIGDVGKANVPERVPNRYNRNTELQVEVKPDQSNICNFELKSDGAKITQPNSNSN